MAVFSTVSRVVDGCGCLAAVGGEVKRLGAGRVHVVAGPSVARVGILDKLLAWLAEDGIAATAFTEVEPEPGLESVARSTAAAQQARPDVVVGIGGGSSLDMAKATAVMLTNEGPIAAYFGLDRVPRPGVPLLLIPTTAGTGSEMSSICVLSDTAHNVKKGVVSEHLFAKTALLDPELTQDLPPVITATTGMDALVHAMESFTGVRATPTTDLFNLEAIGLVAANLRQAFAYGGNLAARENMLRASNLAGRAFSNTQNGLIHALALAIGGRAHQSHGMLTGCIAPWVMEYNLIANPAKYAAIARLFGEPTDGLSEVAAARRSVTAVRSLLADLGMPATLAGLGVGRDAIAGIAAATLGETRLIQNNARHVSEKAIVGLLEAHYDA